MTRPCGRMFSLLLACLAAVPAFAEGEPAVVRPTVVFPEVATRIDLSSTDVNRIVCGDDIKDVVFSQEKGIKVTLSGPNAFLKFLALKQGDRLIHSEAPSEFYVACDGAIFTLIGLPKRIPAQTIRLSSGKKKAIAANQALFSGMPLEKKILKLIKEAYTDQLPESYLVTTLNRPVNLFPALWLTATREIDVEGEGLAVREYRASLRDGQGTVRLSEGDLLRPSLTKSPLAVAIEEPLLTPGGAATRIFIVERRAVNSASGFPAPVPLDSEPIAPSQTPEKPKAEGGHDGA